MAAPTSERPPPTAAEWAAMQATPEFAELRKRLRTFVLPVAALFLGWYALYVLLATYAPGVMSIAVLGNVNLGLLLGLAQFRLDVRDHRLVRAVRRPAAGPAVEPAA